MTKRIKKIIASLLAGCAVCSGSVFSVSAQSLYDRQANDNYRLLQEIIDLYVETSLYKTDRETLVNQMLYNFIAANPDLVPVLANAALKSNDPYSAYHPASSGFMAATTKSYGIVINESSSFENDDPRKTADSLYITEVLNNSNAKFAGILPGDRIVSLDGMNVEGLTLQGVKYLLAFFPIVNKNPEDSKIYQEFSQAGIDPSSERASEYTKLFWNPEKEVTFGLERTSEDGTKYLVEINVPKGFSENKDVYLFTNKENSVATIEFVAFDTETVVEKFTHAFEEAKKSGCKKLIIDLRDNPGGYFEAAHKLGSLFTKGVKPMFYVRNRDSEEPIAYMSTDNYIGDYFEEYVVLINSNTASAAELFAYILREGVGAAIIGETSYGKALGQTGYSIPNGDMFTITTFELLTADKTPYNGVGIVPDIEVPLVPRKYEFPTGLSHFNHENYVTIYDGITNDATLALEQRFGILGIMRDSAIDGLCDESTRAAILAYKYAGMNDYAPNSDIDNGMVSNMTVTINTYKDRYVLADTQTDVANLYLENHSRGKRLAKECRNELAAYEKARAEKEAQNNALLEQEQKALESQSETSSDGN